MAIIIILIAYWFDYKSNKKQFLLDLKGGLFFTALLLIAFVLGYFMLNLGIVNVVLAIGVIIPLSVFVKYLTRN
ncbi:hypothetical protein [uncultured Aquimarina sp.]|uniref:hypothetical protein n=1 Tax=uncultured Aquimarina sp. TaxID=575652 RepID=UPI002623991C|nr:hypothetical protein [uncultured Aquimarina sp.]